MRSEMKMGLGIGLVVLVFVVGYAIVNQHDNSQTASSSDALMTDAGETGGATGEATDTTGGASRDLKTGTPEKGHESEGAVQEHAPSTLSDSGPTVGNADHGAFSDAAEAPATGSENAGSPSPSPIPEGLSETHRPGLSDSTETATGTSGFGGASSADVRRPLDKEVGHSTGETRTPEAETDMGSEQGESVVMTTGSGSGSSENERVVPSPDSSAAANSSSKGAAPKSIATSHTIEAGDTFSGLAVRYFGHAKYAGLISDANPDVDPRRLQVGKTIKIPDTPQRKERRAETAVTSTNSGGGAHSSSVTTPAGASAKAGAPENSSKTSLPPIPEDRKYVVKASDRGWYDMAERLLGDGGEWPMLYETNKERLPDPNNRDLVPVGLEIEIPKTKVIRVSQPGLQ